MRGKRVLIFRGDGGREQLGDTLAARGALVDYVACYRRAKPASGVAGLAEAFRERPDRRGHDHVERRARQPVVARGRRRARRVARLSDVRPASADRRARARDLGLAVVETGGGDAGLIAGLLEWAAAQPARKS